MERITMAPPGNARVNIAARKARFRSRTIEGLGTNETTEFMFEFDLKNRPIDEDKVKEFMKKFSAGENFMKEFPGLVDEDTWVVFDGQHRYEACRRLNIPFVYRWRTKNSELTIDNISKVQSNARWTAEDFMHSFVQQKNQEYIDVQRFVNRYHFSVSTACMLLSINPNNPIGTHLGLKKNGFYEGTFRIVDYKYACEIAQRIEAFIGAGFKQGNQSAFITAYVAAMNHPDYDHKQMMTRLNAYPGILIGQTDANSYLRNLEKLYNYKSHGAHIHFSFPKKNKK